MTKISNCGLICDECDFHIKICPGCFEVKGRTFWSQELPGKICSLFDCSKNDRKYHSCGDCKDLPCRMFIELKDPNISDEEHERLLEIRVKRLKDQ